MRDARWRRRAREPGAGAMRGGEETKGMPVWDVGVRRAHTVAHTQKADSSTLGNLVDVGHEYEVALLPRPAGRHLRQAP